jgi:Uroporphyrinogen decarboxylase (URO-D)
VTRLAEMTGRERTMAAIAHEEPDRVPVAPRIWAWMLAHYGDASLATYLRSCNEFGGDAFWCHGLGATSYVYSWPDQYDIPDVEVGQDQSEEGGCRVIARTFRTPAGVLTDRVRIPPPGAAWGISPNPVVLEHLVKSREDLGRLPYLLRPTITDMSAYHEAERMIGDRGVAEVYIYAPVDTQAGDARGMAELMVDYHDDRAFFDAQLDLFHRRMMSQTKAALEGGVKIIFGSWFYESLSAGWSPTIWREAFLPRLKEQVDLVHSAGALYHLYDDGKMMGLLPMLTEAGVDVVSTCTPPPVADFDLAVSKRDFGDRLCFKGYVDLLYVVKMGTPELVEATVREAMEIGKPGGGFILGSSDSFRDGTPLGNVRAYFDAARRHGRYG